MNLSSALDIRPQLSELKQLTTKTNPGLVDYLGLMKLVVLMSLKGSIGLTIEFVCNPRRVFGNICEVTVYGMVCVVKSFFPRLNVRMPVVGLLMVAAAAYAISAILRAYTSDIGTMLVDVAGFFLIISLLRCAQNLPPSIWTPPDKNIENIVHTD